MVKLFRNDWEESVICLFSENRDVFFTLVIYLIIVIIYNFRILLSVVVCLLNLLCYLLNLCLCRRSMVPLLQSNKIFQ